MNGFSIVFCRLLFIIKVAIGTNVPLQVNDEIDEDLVLSKVRAASKLQCIHHWKRNSKCKDAIFEIEEKLCILLTNLEDDKTHGRTRQFLPEKVSTFVRV